jgi:hypothetical protein
MGRKIHALPNPARNLASPLENVDRAAGAQVRELREREISARRTLGKSRDRGGLSSRSGRTQRAGRAGMELAAEPINMEESSCWTPEPLL